MTVQARWGLVLLLMVQLVGCSQRHHLLEWPGALAGAHTFFGADPMFARVEWGDSPEVMCKAIVCSARPAFSVRLSGGQIIRPHQYTLAGLAALGAEKSQSPMSPARRVTTLMRIEVDLGILSARFDEQERLTSISVTAFKSEAKIWVGDRSARRFAALPASRGELIEVLGEPRRESERDAPLRL
jgi:hypothetical protein